MVGGPTLAVDLGGTRVRAALVDSEGALREHRSTATPHDADLPEMLVGLMRDVAAGRRISGVVVGVPGPVNYARGELQWAPHIPEAAIRGLRGSWLGDRLGVPVTLANDADLGAVGEAYFGAGREFDDVAYLTVSTGVGAGVLLGRHLVHGNRSAAELGHTIVDLAAWSGGEPATLEDFASGSAVARRSTAAGLGPLDAVGLEAAVARDDPAAGALWRTMVEAVAVGVLNLCALFEPQVVVVGGGLGRRERLLKPVRELVANHRTLTPFELVPGQLGDDVGLVGAAAWCRAFMSAPLR